MNIDNIKLWHLILFALLGGLLSGSVSGWNETHQYIAEPNTKDSVQDKTSYPMGRSYFFDSSHGRGEYRILVAVK